MDENTCRALNAINRAFYGSFRGDTAAEFDAARRDPWPGWGRLVPLLAARPPDRPLAVLDLGCGNGRLAAFLADALPARRNLLRYLGIDASETLLDALRARDLPLGEVTALRADFVEDALAELLDGRRFALIALFGVLHHVPSHRLRCELLRSLAERLAPEGLLAVTFWRFGDIERFRSRRLPWSRAGDVLGAPIDESQLEAGDALLAWGPDGAAFRYCHHADDDEVRRLVAASGLPVVAAYDADGRDGNFNRYVVLGTRGEP